MGSAWIKLYNTTTLWGRKKKMTTKRMLAQGIIRWVYDVHCRYKKKQIIICFGSAPTSAHTHITPRPLYLSLIAVAVQNLLDKFILCSNHPNWWFIMPAGHSAKEVNQFSMRTIRIDFFFPRNFLFVWQNNKMILLAVNLRIGIHLFQTEIETHSIQALDAGCRLQVKDEKNRLFSNFCGVFWCYD